MKNAEVEILVAHPRATVRQVIENNLRYDGYTRLLAVEDGREALEQLQHRTPHVVVTATDLGDIDGWGLNRLIRSSGISARTLPVVAIAKEPRSAIGALLAIEHAIRIVPATRLDSLSDAVAAALSDQPHWQVLMVASDRRAAAAAARSLGSRFRVAVETSLDAGLKTWGRQRHELILLDIASGGASAVDWMASVLETDPHQPIIALCHKASADQYLELVRAGAIDCLKYPLDPAALPGICEATLRRSALLAAYTEHEENQRLLEEMAARVQVADDRLVSGQTVAASYYLRSALALTRPPPLSEDEWCQLITELPSEYQPKHIRNHR